MLKKIIALQFCLYRQRGSGDARYMKNIVHYRLLVLNLPMPTGNTARYYSEQQDEMTCNMRCIPHRSLLCAAYIYTNEYSNARSAALALWVLPLSFPFNEISKHKMIMV